MVQLNTFKGSRYILFSVMVPGAAAASEKRREENA